MRPGDKMYCLGNRKGVLCHWFSGQEPRPPIPANSNDRSYSSLVPMGRAHKRDPLLMSFRQEHRLNQIKKSFQDIYHAYLTFSLDSDAR
jgi:hypothetical protein